MELEAGQAIIAVSLALAAVITFIVEKLRREQKSLRQENREDHNKVILGLHDIYDQVKDTREDVKEVRKDLGRVNDRLTDHLGSHNEQI